MYLVCIISFVEINYKQKGCYTVFNNSATVQQNSLRQRVIVVY